MTKAQKIAAVLLAGVGAITLQFTGAEAQARLTARTAYNNHDGLRHSRSTDSDGGVVIRDFLQEYSDACTAERRKLKAAQLEHITAGTKTAGEVKDLRTAANTVCAAYDTLNDSIVAARVVYEGADQAYGCQHLDGPCPDGGS